MRSTTMRSSARCCPSCAWTPTTKRSALVNANPYANGVARLHARRRCGAAVPDRRPGRHGGHQRADPGADGVVLLRRLEGLAVRRHAHVRPGRHEVLHPQQSGHQALARSGNQRREPGVPADPVTHPALADAAPTSAWLDSPARPDARPPLTADTHGGPGGRRRRVHRALDRAARQGARPRPRRGAGRGAAHRLGGVRAQRRVLLGVADPRSRQRRAAVPRRDRRPSSGSGSRTSPSSSRRSAATASTATSGADRVAVGRDRAAPGGVAAGRPVWRATGSTSTGRRSVPRSTRRRTSPVSGSVDDNALVDPARLAWGLAEAAERLGVRIHEDTYVTDLGARTVRGWWCGRRSGHTVRAGARGPRHQCVPPARECGCAGTRCRSTTTR